jgi:Gas vesicle synthesis protein GvpL/GvpF
VSTYVYAFTGASHPLPVDGLAGVGERKPALRLVRQDGLAAVVSDAPENLRAKRRDVEAHERVLDTLLAAGTVLPMRFGMVAADDDAVKAELASGAKRYTRLLKRLGGKVEVNVKAVHREEAVLRELLLGDRKLRKLREAMRAADGGSHQDKLAFGQEVSAALDARRSQDADRVVVELRPHASAVKLGPPVDGCFVNVSFLLGATEREDFEAALSRLRQELSELAEVRLYGPLPPYSFLAPAEAGD